MKEIQIFKKTNPKQTNFLENHPIQSIKKLGHSIFSLKKENPYIKFLQSQNEDNTPFYTAEIAFSTYDKVCIDHQNFDGLLSALALYMPLIVDCRRDY